MSPASCSRYHLQPHWTAAISAAEALLGWLTLLPPPGTSLDQELRCCRKAVYPLEQQPLHAGGERGPTQAPRVSKDDPVQRGLCPSFKT